MLIQIIYILLFEGLTLSIERAIFFDISSFDRYTRLSNLPRIQLFSTYFHFKKAEFHYVKRTKDK